MPKRSDMSKPKNRRKKPFSRAVDRILNATAQYKLRRGRSVRDVETFANTEYDRETARRKRKK